MKSIKIFGFDLKTKQAKQNKKKKKTNRTNISFDI